MNTQNNGNTLFPTNHDYYASSQNYYDSSSSETYANWQDFADEYEDADINMNLVFRWDIKQHDERNSFYMQVVIIRQRKGIYAPILIESIDPADEPKIMEFMKPHFDKLISNWQPFSDKFLNK